ncbi:hypothetical protein CSKR_103630 [Clonorchis sinensis]|uniref:Uncharacterized protein n=1 Tax=Clonorchis sinensis TaxID=79923 RepID=A0A3R7C9R6_CLOSI|nr:hypothetical protein CSKR_103630 [Clonorchis sinensis]
MALPGMVASTAGAPFSGTFERSLVHDEKYVNTCSQFVLDTSSRNSAIIPNKPDFRITGFSARCLWSVSTQSILQSRGTVSICNDTLKSLTARQQCLVGSANALPFLWNKSPHVPAPNLEGQETVFVRPLTVDHPTINNCSAVTPFWCTASTPRGRSTRTELQSIYPNPDNISRHAEVGFEPEAFQSDH